MPRSSQGHGVGRGNGAGSRKGQFKTGMPSGNPKGRPRTRKQKPSTTVAEAARNSLTETVPVRLSNGRTEWMTRLDAMMKKMMSGFGDASFKDQLAFMRLCNALGIVAEQPPYEPPADTVALILAEIDAALKEDEQRKHIIEKYQ